MHEPELYHKSHKSFKRATGILIKKYLSKFQWHNDGSDILMDIGTGPGDLFMDYIYPELPKEYDRAICADVSKDMLDYAKKLYKNANKCEYRLYDITSAEELPMDLKGKVHHLTAIHLMHWIENLGEGTTLKNMYELLSPNGGDCLIIFMPHHSLFDFNELIKKSPKWSHYLQHIEEFMPKSYHNPDVVDKFRLMLENASFSEITTEEITGVAVYENHQQFKENFKPVCGLLKYIPENQQSEFLDDMTSIMVDIFAKYPEAKEIETKYGFHYHFIVAHAKRLPK